MTTAGPESLPDLLYSETETALADSLRSLLADRAGLDKALARIESGQTYDDDLWQAVAAELGCAGLLIPERHGGAGASYREAASAAEALGGTVAPVPYLGSAVVATAALLSAGEGVPADLLRRMAAGEATVALAAGFATRPGSPFPLTVRLAGPQPGDAANGVARLRGTVTGWPTRCRPACCLCPPTGCRLVFTWWTWRQRACRRRPWCPST